MPNAYSNKDISYGGYYPGSLGDVVHLHGVYYARNWDFGLQFERMVADGLSSFLGQFKPDKELFLTVRNEQGMLGSFTVQQDETDPQMARIRWVILAEQAHGLGIGKEMMKRGMAFIRQAGYRQAKLNTFRGLDAARSLYERHGFVLKEEKPSDGWGVTVNEQSFTWQAPGP